MLLCQNDIMMLSLFTGVNNCVRYIQDKYRKTGKIKKGEKKMLKGMKWAPCKRDKLK